MAITTASGTKMYIGPAGDLQSISPDQYTEIKEVQSYGEFGDESPVVTAASVGDARVRKLKGARDAGTMQLVCFRDPLDPGQIALKAAERTKFEYNFKVVAEDAPSEAYTDTVYTFQGLVMSARDNYGENDNIVTTTFQIGINSEITEVPAELISGA